MEEQLQNETVFYQDSNVTVTKSRYITNSKTYVMRNISSVHIFEIIKSRTIPVILVALGCLMLFLDGARIIGLLLIVLGILCLILIKNEFAVRISTNSGEANSIVSKDKIYIGKIVSALNEAIIHRG